VSKIPLCGESPSLGYPWKGVVYIAVFLREYWSVGVVEYCKSNEQKTSEYIVTLEDTVVLDLQLGSSEFLFFQYSSAPSLQYSG